MVRIYTIFLLVLYFTFSNPIDANRLIQNSNSDHRLMASNKEMYKTNQTNTPPLVKSHRRLLNERLVVIITISSISIGIMVVVVCTLIAVKYLRTRQINVPETTEQSIPLHRTSQVSRKTKATAT